MLNRSLKRRILEISYKHKLSHIGSCISAVDIIEEIYQTKKKDEKFILSAGHAGLALYCVIEKHLGIDAESIFNHHGVHPDRCELCHLDCSSGSLGHGLPIAIGMALAKRSKNVYVLCSDGELSEGSCWEAWHNVYEHKLENIQIYINSNGWGAYGKPHWLVTYFSAGMDFESKQFHTIDTNMDEWPSWLQGQQAHYVVMDQQQYEEALECLQ